MFDTAIVPDEFNHIFSLTTTLVSICANSFLIFVVSRTQVNHIGPYRWLLLGFSAVDIGISTVHTVLVPSCHMTEFGYIFWGNRFLNESNEIGLAACLFWNFLFYQTFILLAFQYVYRYVILCNPPWLSWIQLNPWRNWIVIAVLADTFFVGAVVADTSLGFKPSDVSRTAFAPVLKEVYRIDLFSDNQPGYLAAIYWIIDTNGEKVWLARATTATCILNVLFFGTALVIGFCLMRIVQELRPKEFTISTQSRQVQRQLFRALLWQTFIPTVTSYVPLAVVFLQPLMIPISLGGLGTIAAMSCQLFPMIDPMLVFLFVKGYRATLLQFVQNGLSTTQAKSTVMK